MRILLNRDLIGNLFHEGRILLLSALEKYENSFVNAAFSGNAFRLNFLKNKMIEIFLLEIVALVNLLSGIISYSLF